MMTSFLHSVLPWLVIMTLLQKKIQKNRFFISPVVPFFFVGLLVAGILFLPIISTEMGGVSLALWSSSLMRSVSLPLIGLLVIVMMDRLFSCQLFLHSEWRTLWIFGMSSSLLLYPAALGLGHIDPYCWGWGNRYFLITLTLVTLLLLLAKNRFAILLLLALAAYDLQLQESTNLWDYLIDPIYAILAMIFAIPSLFVTRKQAPTSSLFLR